MKTYIRNGQKFLVNEELYNKIKKTKIFEAGATANPANPSGNTQGNVQANPQNTQQNQANPQNTQQIDFSNMTPPEQTNMYNEENYTKIADSVINRLKKKFNNEYLKQKYVLQADMVGSFLRNLYDCMKNNIEDKVNFLNNNNVNRKTAGITIVNELIKDTLNNPGSSFAERLGPPSAKELYYDINSTLQLGEQTHGLLDKEYDKICNVILHSENPDDKSIYDMDVTKYIENIYNILGKNTNSSDYKQQVEATIKHSLYDEQDGVQVILKNNKNEICNNIVRQKQEWNGEFLEKTIRRNLLNVLTSDSYINKVTDKMVKANKITDSSKINELRTAIKGYLTALASENYFSDDAKVNKERPDTSDEEKNEVSMLEKLDVGYVSYITVYDDGGLINLEDVKYATEKNTESDETATIYLDSTGKNKKVVPVKKGNPIEKELVLPTSEYYDFSISGTELVFKKNEESKKAEEIDGYNITQIKNKTKDNKNKVHNDFRTIANMRQNIKDCIIDFVKDNKEFFGDYKVVAIVCDNSEHKNPIDEFIINLKNKETLRFHSLPSILESVKKDGDEIIDLNPTVVAAFDAWRSYIEEHNSGNDESFDSPKIYNKVVDNITNKLSSIYNLYMNTKNIQDKSEIAKNIVGKIDSLNEKNTIEYCRELLLCINNNTRSGEELTDLLSEAKKSNKKQQKVKIDNPNVKFMFNEIKTLKKMYNIDKEQFYDVYSELGKVIEQANTNGFENDVKKLVNAITDLFAIKRVTGKPSGKNDKSNLYARYYSYMLTKVLKTTLDNDIHDRYDRLSDAEKSKFNKLSTEFKKAPGEESADDILENYLYYTDEYPSEDDIEKYKTCLQSILEYSSDMHSIISMLKNRLSEERIGTFQYMIKTLNIQDVTFGSFLKAFITGRKVVSVNDLLKIKTIADSQLGQALKYSFLVEYYNKKKLNDDSTTKRTYDNIIKDIIESDSEKLDTKTISDKCLREIVILSGDFDGKRFISALREIDDFNKKYSIEEFQSKKYGNDNNNITTACITKGNKCIGYIQIYRLFGTIKGMFGK